MIDRGQWRYPEWQMFDQVIHSLSNHSLFIFTIALSPPDER